MDLSSGSASPWKLSLLGYPDGLDVRLLAWPVLICSIPFEYVLGPVAAFNLGVLLWLTLQGVVVGILGARLGWPLHARLVAAAAIITAPTTLRALGNGQFENLTAVALVMGLMAILSSGRTAALWGAGAGLIASFSSPYQGVVLGALLGVGVLLHRPRETWPALAGAAASTLIAVAYFLGVTSGHVHLSAVPAPGAMAESASLGEVFLPWLYAPPHTTGELPAAGLKGITESFEALSSTPLRYEFGASWPWVNSVAYGYTGGFLILLGAWGLWSQRRETICRVLAVFGLLCLCLAMGRQLVLSPGNETSIPMLWALPSLIGSLEQMQATVRFLTGLGFAAVIGVGFLCSRLGPRSSAGLALLVIADGLFLAPAHWPVPASGTDISPIESTLSDGPVASWPGPPTLAPRHHQTLALLLERPVAWFSGTTPELLETQGAHATELEENEFGEEPDEWLRRVKEAGVLDLVEFQTPEGKNLGAVFRQKEAPVCGDQLCAYSLREARPQSTNGNAPAEPER